MIVLQAKRLNCNRKKWIYIGGGDQKFVLTRGQQQLPFLTNWCSLGAATNCLLHEWRVIFSIYEALIYVSSQDKLCIWFLPITNKCPFQRGCTIKQGNWVLFLYPRVRAHHTWQWQGDLTSPSGDNREKWEHLKETSIRNSGACPLKLLSQNKKCLVSLLFTIT